MRFHEKGVLSGELHAPVLLFTWKLKSTVKPKHAISAWTGLKANRVFHALANELADDVFCAVVDSDKREAERDHGLIRHGCAAQKIGDCGGRCNNSGGSGQLA